VIRRGRDPTELAVARDLFARPDAETGIVALRLATRPVLSPPSSRDSDQWVVGIWDGARQRKAFRHPMNIYVGNLSFRSTEADLERLFNEYGQVDSAAVITDRDTGRSRGFGFVEMANDDEARKAIEELDGHEIEGRKLRVNEAQPRQRR
jgi:hypothetical protein